MRTTALHELLARVVADFRRPALASSLSAEDMALTHAIAELHVPIDVFVIDTGRLHAETLELLATARRHFGIAIDVLTPDAAQVRDYVEHHGNNAFYDSVDLRHRCCEIRKVEPLARALAGRDAWLTGQRRAQSPERAGLQEREFDAARGIAKFNPLAAWSDRELNEYIEQHDIPVNPLHARGYPSIGCEPCTRAVRPGEDPRAGRWWWEQDARKECGLHLHRIEKVVQS
jgi:phosphoadenosine phosphosulfate reductase